MLWKPKYTAVVSALQLAAAFALLTPAKAQDSADGSSNVIENDGRSLLWVVLMFTLFLYGLHKLFKELLVDARWITESIRDILYVRFPPAEREPDATSVILEHELHNYMQPRALHHRHVQELIIQKRQRRQSPRRRQEICFRNLSSRKRMVPVLETTVWSSSLSSKH